MKIAQKKYLSLLLIVAFCLFSAGSSPRASDDLCATVLYDENIYPMVFPGENDNSITISFTSWNGEPVSLYFGIDDGSGSPGSDCVCIPMLCHKLKKIPSLYATYQHSLELSVDLNTSYLYGIAEPGHFPELFYPYSSGSSDSSTVLFISDPHLSNREEADDLESSMESAVQTAEGPNGSGPVDLIMCAGDFMDRIDYYQGWFAERATITRSTPFATICGNHDKHTTLFEFMKMPNCDPALGDYYFIRGGVLYICLHSGPKNLAFQHVSFLRNSVQSAGEHRWTVLLIHYSMQSNGIHGMDGPVLSYRRLLEKVISELDIDLVISGHDHQYNRSGLIGRNGLVRGSDGSQLEKSPGETLYIALPAATEFKFYDLSKRILKPNCYPLAAEALEQEAGYMLANFTNDSISLKTYGLRSGLIDEVTLSKTAG